MAPPSPTSGNSVAVFFTCTGCGQSYCHVAAADRFAGTLNVTAGSREVLAFSGQYIHCGQAMQKTGSAVLRIDGRISEDEFPNARDACLEIRVMECPCGFRLDLPAY